MVEQSGVGLVTNPEIESFGTVTMRHKQQASVACVAKPKASVTVRIIPAAIVLPKVYPLAQVTLTHRIAQ
jgi:hypothetical protein